MTDYFTGSPAPWWPQYLTLLAAVIVQPFFDQFRKNGKIDGSEFTFGWILFSAIVTVLIFPGVYRNAFDPQKPVAVQLCTIFAAGFGWQSLLATAIQAAPRATQAIQRAIRGPRQPSHPSS